MGVFIMKKIIINSPTYGKHIVFVDDKDYLFLVKFTWNVRKVKHTFYALRWDKMIKGERKRLIMHRVIMGVTDSKIFVDHKDHNGLNNQKNNLRPCTPRQNVHNRVSTSGTSSKYLGVSLNVNKRNRKEYKYWVVNFMVNGKSTHVGNFPFTKNGEILAAKRYDEYAKKYYGEFANLNFK